VTEIPDGNWGQSPIRQNELLALRLRCSEMRDCANWGSVPNSPVPNSPSACLFLYRHVISREVGDLGDVIRGRIRSLALSGRMQK